MSKKVSCVILGAGGHARMLLECLRFSPDIEIVGILDPSPSLQGNDWHGVPVLGDDNLLEDLSKHGVNHFVIGMGGVGNNLPRKKMFETALGYGLVPLDVKHPTAILSPSAVYGKGCQFLPGSIVNTEAVLGSNIIINSGAIIEHDCVLADHVHVATGAKLAGSVHVGEGAHIGAGATVRQGILIGEFAIVGLGAAVVKDVPPYTTVVGVPAKIRQEKVIK
jgi:UDP-perosamine 4-acetyltransferase